MTSRKSNRSTVTSCTALHMEWDRISCPICMEQPHNAVLLICSSYKNGCRCYVCNTSHRHSNCLDRFREMNGDSKVRASHSTTSVISNSNNRTVERSSHYSMIPRQRRTNNANNQEPANSTLSVEDSIVMEECHDAMQSSADLKCPLCRGSVSGWIPASEVRKYLNEKLRACSHESCKFVGTYEQLREHARTVHLLAKPAHVDLSRKRTWDLLEREQEVGDVISAIRSQNPGAIIVGDYVIETRDAMSPDENTGDESNDEWYSPVQDSLESPDNSDRSSSRSDWHSIRRPSSRNPVRRGFFSRQHMNSSSNYRGFRPQPFDRPNGSNYRSGINRSLDDPSTVPRRQRLRYTHRRHHTRD
ncbi:uncharacterized protein LOC102713833 isoform X2 [Oryza brachyantha]|uniref:uncharacterized protein LOC102713833 isoform X2 n=1 Tax=Oryza brachyantha TaxID=4533 RepID=UPI0003EAAB1C|nr:uncharacterized protein LOC102713833 isoform X2 [Oryza brachyantha]